MIAILAGLIEKYGSNHQKTLTWYFANEYSNERVYLSVVVFQTDKKTFLNVLSKNDTAQLALK